MKELFSLLAKIETNKNEAISEIKAVDKQGEKTSSNMGKNFKKLGVIIKTVTIGSIALVGTALVKMGVDGTKNLIKISDAAKRFQSETGASADEAEKFSDTIQKLHKVNTDSYEEIGDAVITFRQKFGKLGDDAEKITQSFLDFSKSTKQDVGGAIMSVDGILKSFGLTTGDATDVMDKLQVAYQETGIEIKDLQEVLGSGSTTFKSFGMNIDDSIAFISNFAKQGVKASSVARGLTNVVKFAENPTKVYGDAFEALGVKIDETGKPIGGAKKALELLKIRLDDGKLSQKEFAATAVLFGSRIATDFVRGLKGGTKSVNELKKSIENSSGAVKKASDNFDKQFGERWTLFKRKYIEPFAESLGKNIIDSVESSGLTIEQFGDNIVGFINNYVNPFVKKIVNGFGEMGRIAGEFSIMVEQAFDKVVDAYDNITKQATETLRSLAENISTGWMIMTDKKGYDRYVQMLSDMKAAEMIAWQNREKRKRERAKRDVEITKQREKQNKLLIEESDKWIIENSKKTADEEVKIEKKKTDEVAKVVKDGETEKQDIIKKSTAKQKDIVTIGFSDILGVVSSGYDKIFGKSQESTINVLSEYGRMFSDGFDMVTGFYNSWGEESGTLTDELQKNNENTFVGLDYVIAKSFNSLIENADSIKGVWTGLKGFFKDFLGYFKDKIIAKLSSMAAEFLIDYGMELFGYTSKEDRNSAGGGGSVVAQPDTSASPVRSGAVAVGMGIGAYFGGPVGAAVGGAVGNFIGSLFHSGGIVGESIAKTRSLPISTWSNAPRMHNGGLAGNEVPAILQKGEEVLTANDPRHMNNGGGFDTANLTIMMNERVLMQTIGMKLVKNVRMNTGVKR